MAEKIKKGFFKVLPLSVVILMVAALTVGVWQASELPAQAAGDGAASNIRLYDFNGNGKIDRIVFDIKNDSLHTWAVQGSLPYGLSVTQATQPITISAVTVTSAATAPAVVQVDLSEADGDLLVNTDGVNTGAVELAYTTVAYGGPGDRIEDGTDTALGTIAGDDALVNDMEIDNAAPVLVSATYRDLDTDGAVDALRTTWSETVLMFGSTAPDWTIVGGDVHATFSAADDDGSSSAILDVTVTADTDETSSTVAPTIAYDNDDADDSITDMALTPNPADTTGPVTATDRAAPHLTSATYSDSSHDGKVDRVVLLFSEVTTLTTITAADWAFSAAGDIGLTGDFAAAECTGSGTLATITCTDAGTGTVDATASRTGKQTGAGTEPTFTYTNNTNNINDTVNNTATFGPVTLIDGAAPVLVTSSPADSATGVALDANLVLTFSEVMTEASATGAIARSPSFTLGAASWNAADTVLTYSAHDAFAGLQIYTITLAGTIASTATTDGNLGAGPVSNPFTFTTVASGGGGGGGGGLPASVTVTTPNGGETLTGGGTYNITWSVTGTVTDPVSIYYSTDSGINFPNTIATGETNDGSYTWTVPNAATTAAKIKVASGSLNDVSDANFSITYSASAVSATNSSVSATPTSVVANGTSKSTVTVIVKDASSNLLSGKVVTLASSRGTSDTITTVTGTTGTNGVATFEVKSSTAGTSNYTATAAGVVLSSTAAVVFAAPGEVGETPTAINVGDLIKSPLSTSVYYYGSDNKRHLFPNEKTYKSWYVDFSNIKSVTASQLQGLTLGENVTVRAGTVLVKIQTDPKVYAVEPGGLLRWVPTEARAATLYGTNWAQKIIDVPLVFWVDYTFGSDITTDKHPTGAVIQYTGTTDKYYVQGADKRLISTAGFTANKFQLSNVLSIPTSITYTLGTPLVAEETALTRIY